MDKTIILEYIWLDGNLELRSKYRTVYLNAQNNFTLSVDKWNYDGSSTYQAETENSEITLNPVATYPNPFFPDGTAYLVLCDTYTQNEGKYIPTASNHRVHANEIFKKNPFASLDQTGVGQLVKIAIEKGRQTRPDIKLGICGEHGGEPESVKFCHRVGLSYVSCSPYRVPVARLAAAQAAIEEKRAAKKK
mgnify:CR=1 FL=1